MCGMTEVLGLDLATVLAYLLLPLFGAAVVMALVVASVVVSAQFVLESVDPNRRCRSQFGRYKIDVSSRSFVLSCRKKGLAWEW